jgi:hypothetical protein
MLNTNLFMLISVTQLSWECNRLDRLRSLTRDGAGKPSSSSRCSAAIHVEVGGENLMTSSGLQQKERETRDDTRTICMESSHFKAFQRKARRQVKTPGRPRTNPAQNPPIKVQFAVNGNLLDPDRDLMRRLTT